MRRILVEGKTHRTGLGQAAALAFLSVLGVLFYLHHLKDLGFTYGSLDWKYFHYLFEAGRTSIVEYGQFPGWSPYTCGGVPLHADPQTPFLSPFFLPVLLFGTVPGMKLYVLLHILAGLAGGWYLARTLGFRGAAALFLPVGFALGSRFAWIVQGGQFTMLTFQFLPWMLAFYIRSLDDLRFSMAGAAVFALTVIEGGTYGAPMGAFFLGCYAAYRFLTDRFAPRALVSLALVLGLGVLLAAPKLVPMLGFWMDHRRFLPATDDSLGLLDALRMFFDRRFSPYMIDRAAYPHLKYGWWGEYGAWIGPVTAALAAGAFVTRFKKSLPWLIIGIVSLAVMLGSHGPYSPWELLRHLPVFDSLRVPGRYAMLVNLALVIAASGMVHELGRMASHGSARLPFRPPKWVPWLLTVLVAADLVVFSNQVLATISNQPVPEVSKKAAFDKEPGARRDFEAYVRANEGTLACRNELIATSKTRLPTRRLAAMGHEATLSRPPGAALAMTRWTPNEMEVEVSSSRTATVLFRTNFDPNWKTDAGVLRNEGGLLALDVPAGGGKAKVRFSTDRLTDGVAVSAAVLAILVAVLVFGRLRGLGMPATPRPVRGAREPMALVVLCGAALLFLYVFPYFGGLNNPSENSRILMSRAILDHGTFVVDEAMGGDYSGNGDLAVRDGRHYSCKAPGVSYLGVPALAGARLLGAQSRRAETYAMRLLLSTIPSVVFLLLFGRFLRPFVSDRRGWALVVIGLSAGSMFFTYGMLLYGHQQAALSLFGAFMAFFYNRNRACDSKPLLAGGGLLLALAVACEYQSFFSAVVVGLYGLSTMRRRLTGVALVMAGAALPVALTMLYHREAFGTVFSTGHDFLESATYRSYQVHGYKGMFTYSWDGFYGTLLSPRNGLLFYAPWLVLSVLGVRSMFQRPGMRREALAVAGAVLAYVAFICGMFAWKGGWSVGPRYLDAAVPFMALSVAAFLGSPQGVRPGARAAAAALILPSVAIYGLSTAWYPHFPESIENPFFEFLMPLVGTGRAPWSLGAVLGVEGTWGMLPYLAVLLVFVGLVAWNGSAGAADGIAARRRLAVVVLIVGVASAAMWGMSRPVSRDPKTVGYHLDLAGKVWEPRPVKKTLPRNLRTAPR